MWRGRRAKFEIFSIVSFLFLIFLLAGCETVKAVRKYFLFLKYLDSQCCDQAPRQEKIIYIFWQNWWCVSYTDKALTALHPKLTVTKYPCVTWIARPCYRSLGQLETGDLLNFPFKLINNIFDVPGEKKVSKTPVYFHYSVHQTSKQYHSSGGQNRGCFDSWR